MEQDAALQDRAGGECFQFRSCLFYLNFERLSPGLSVLPLGTPHSLTHTQFTRERMLINLGYWGTLPGLLVLLLYYYCGTVVLAGLPGLAGWYRYT